MVVGHHQSIVEISKNYLFSNDNMYDEEKEKTTAGSEMEGGNNKRAMNFNYCDYYDSIVIVGSGNHCIPHVGLCWTIYFERREQTAA